MEIGALYQRSNGVQRRDAKQVLDEFGHLFQWRADGKDAVLDIGCGSGDVTVDFILPILPLKFSRLVGVDLSDGMLRYARENYQQYTKLAFEKIDIGGKLDLRTFPEQFDHITSFYCLHWVENQKMALNNIYNLLTSDGDCLLVFLAENPIFEIYKQLSMDKKWAPYMTDVNRFISPYQYSANPADDFGSILYGAGFTEYSVVVREKLFVYDGIDVLKSEFYFYLCVFFFFYIFHNSYIFI